MPLSLSVLKKVAIAGGVVAIGGASFFTWKIQDNFRKELYYTRSMELLLGYPPAVKILGQPIKTGRLDLSGSSENFSDGLNASLTIPLRGPKEKGTLYCTASRRSASEIWTVDKLDLEVKNRKWTFYIDPNSTAVASSQDLESISSSESTVGVPVAKDLEYLKLKS